MNWVLATLFHIPPIMGQQALCQDPTPSPINQFK
jgi:hypothetical protein